MIFTSILDFFEEILFMKMQKKCIEMKKKIGFSVKFANFSRIVTCSTVCWSTIFRSCHNNLIIWKNRTTQIVKFDVIQECYETKQIKLMEFFMQVKSLIVHVIKKPNKRKITGIWKRHFWFHTWAICDNEFNAINNSLSKPKMIFARSLLCVNFTWNVCVRSVNFITNFVDCSQTFSAYGFDWTKG